VIIKLYNLIIRTFFRAISLIVQILHKSNVLEHSSIINLNFLYRYPSPGISREMRKQKKNDICSNAYKVFNNKFRILYKINQI